MKNGIYYNLKPRLEVGKESLGHFLQQQTAVLKNKKLSSSFDEVAAHSYVPII